MSRTSIAAAVLVAAFVIEAGAFAATPETSTAKAGDPVATLAVMAQLEKSDAAKAGAAAVERVADAKGNLHVPEDYRARYRFIGSWAVAGDDKGSGSKEIHTVYA